ncbi:hypothetical protein [Glycomyces salinus]|uniref:hypothetical protein n=1 Tax=Glycomyces salinus TaxID=980294 RepID=UPI0018EAF665|nr:hypothetical protein [Glycomyces salinus]
MADGDPQAQDQGASMTEQQPDRSPPDDDSPEIENEPAEEAESDGGREPELSRRWLPGGPLVYDDPDARPPPPEPGNAKKLGHWVLRRFTKQFTFSALLLGVVATCIGTGLKAILPPDEQNEPGNPMESLSVSIDDLHSAVESQGAALCVNYEEAVELALELDPGDYEAGIEQVQDLAVREQDPRVSTDILSIGYLLDEADSDASMVELISQQQESNVSHCRYDDLP